MPFDIKHPGLDLLSVEFEHFFSNPFRDYVVGPGKAHHRCRKLDGFLLVVHRGKRQPHYLTGDKGLNHALWAIRAALADNVRSPRFIRTVPRLGYQWIHEKGPQTTRRSAASARYVFSRTAGIAALVLKATAGGSISRTSPDTHENSELTSAERITTRAYRVNRDIHVEFEGGRLGIRKNANNADIGKPVLSADSGQVSVAIHENRSCRRVTIDVSDGERQDFGACPSETIWAPAIPHPVFRHARHAINFPSGATIQADT